jgi:deazaflavin-dependent oxidoreductase (nitroreductase family)
MIIPDGFWSKIKNVQRIHQRLYAVGKGWVVGWIILLLGHTGRKSGRQYNTPLQYEKIEGCYYVGAGRGTKADWYRNILVNREVHVQVGRISFDGWAEPITNLQLVVAFLNYRFKKHPFMMGLMMRFHSLPMQPNDSQLEELAKTLAIVVLHPGQQGQTAVEEVEPAKL